jgi:hypothetical protein
MSLKSETFLNLSHRQLRQFRYDLQYFLENILLGFILQIFLIFAFSIENCKQLSLINFRYLV